jgi:hypothetical protein
MPGIHSENEEYSWKSVGAAVGCPGVYYKVYELLLGPLLEDRTDNGRLDTSVFIYIIVADMYDHV